jgi:hypothetical protein
MAEGRSGPLPPRLLLRAEGAAVFALSLVVYGHIDESWWLFLALFLVPDVSILLYFAVPRPYGAAIYNLVHTYVLPLALGIYGVAANVELAVAIALIWSGHIGIDRLLGFGLKYETDFKDTHLQRA